MNQPTQSNNSYPNNAKELRLLYKCHANTWRVWIRPLLIDLTIKPNTKVYTPKQVNAIIKLLDPPN